MSDWYRQIEWNDEIAQAFFSCLERARNKAQYLNIQAYTLLASHPAVAAELCRKVLTLDTPDQHARAGLYLGTALAASGDIDGAIAALEDAIETERNHPMHRTGAYMDQALLVAVSKRSDMYDRVRTRLEEHHALPLDEQMPAVLIATSLIGAERSDDVGPTAAAALAALDTMEPGDSELPSFLNFRDIRNRLVTIAEG
ncbi:hypothetical protein [Croceicoccus bisphenolivorans]|uniref:hypothetical protein n=1 Tax=Croceicoccus bisphenolivorans TaxID=1783232 RepID=UPI000833AEDA|nr:hypothetical protein [Croceicoccus bisphenolivorans]